MHVHKHFHTKNPITQSGKYLTGITPATAVSFLSAGCGERASDMEITLKSGFLDKLTHGYCVLAAD